MDRKTVRCKQSSLVLLVPQAAAAAQGAACTPMGGKGSDGPWDRLPGEKAAHRKGRPERRTLMASVRLSRLQKWLLGWLRQDHQRTQGRTSSSHYELIRAFPSDKSNISHSLRTLEARGLLV